MPAARGLGAVICVALLIAPTLWDQTASRLAARGMQSPTVRFHHAHYVVGDPSAAISEAARRTEGIRVILQGLGVGVRAGREFLLFDRGEAPASAWRTAVEAYPLAVEQLRAWGFTAEPAAASESRVAAAMNGLAVDHLAFATDDLNAAAQRLEAAGARITGRREDSLRVDAQHDLVIEIVRDTDRAETYWCPMHPDVRSADAGKCPVCGMALVPIPPPRLGEYRLDVDQIRDAGRRTTGLTIAIREPDTNAAVTKFSFVHERLLHLFIVSRDLTYFAHVHPEQQADGRFVLQHPLDGGEYMLIADFVPSSGTSQLLQKAIIVGGPAASSAEPNDSPGRLKVSMTVDGELAAGKDARLTFTVRDATTGMPVSDLQPYLGAPAHMLLVRSDLTDAVHAHPEEQVAAGPSVRFHPLIPAPGAYKLWVQFQRRGQVSTSTFDLVVPR